MHYFFPFRIVTIHHPLSDVQRRRKPAPPSWAVLKDLVLFLSSRLPWSPARSWLRQILGTAMWDTALGERTSHGGGNEASWWASAHQKLFPREQCAGTASCVPWDSVIWKERHLPQMKPSFPSYLTPPFGSPSSAQLLWELEHLTGEAQLRTTLKFVKNLPGQSQLRKNIGLGYRKVNK